MKRLLLVVFCCFYIAALFAQSPKAIEDDLLKSIKKIEAFVPSGISAPAHEFDSLEQENNRLSKKLLYYTAKYPLTISQKFKSFSDSGLGEATSADGLLRIYFWNTGLGGTQQQYMNVFQYKTENKVKSTEPKDNPIKIPAYDTIYILKRANKTYYLAIYDAQMDLSDHTQGIQVFSIENGVLNSNVKLIKTKTGLHSTLEYDYNARFVYEDDDEWPSIKYNEKSATLKIPIVMENGRGNGNFITYKFTGQYFERVKN